ncbi:hypothetical protein [Actinomadura fibrosa]|uniref:Glycosyltransferase n=1 Tax=Actinomadura fibrosa TaxID=111802 RepID=A0ABW2XUS1_9ACTN|nr:hypothetical protein [Actinomadura fibrosa]
MAARPIDPADPGVRRAHRIARPAAAPASRLPLRRRLVAVSPSVPEAVRSAGGWLFDHATAGWDVTVLTDDMADPRPLRILGARHMRLESALAMPARDPRPHVLAISADLYWGRSNIRRMVAALGDAPVEVLLWGGDDARTGAPHRLSTAARAFKAHAMAASACAPGVPARSAGRGTVAGPDAGAGTAELFRPCEPAPAVAHGAPKRGQ